MCKNLNQTRLIRNNERINRINISAPVCFLKTDAGGFKHKEN